jgi:hypothetical protein
LSGIITDINKYRKGWTGGGEETPCGFGSKVSQTKIQREWIPQQVVKYGIHTIDDIGAGDLNWIELVKWPAGVEYRAFDLVPRHPSVVEFDLLHEIPDSVDLILCLWVLNHLPEDHASQALSNLLASGCKYLMYTWWPAMFPFLDLGAMESTVIRTRQKENGPVNFEIRMIEC